MKTNLSILISALVLIAFGCAPSDAEQEQITLIEPDKNDDSTQADDEEDDSNTTDDDEESENDEDIGVSMNSLSVEANGVKIGELVAVSERSFYIWNTEHNLLFYLDDSTGFVLGNAQELSHIYYETDDCSGQPIQGVINSPDAGCTTPQRKNVGGYGGTYGTEPDSLFTWTNSGSVPKTPMGFMSGDTCVPLVDYPLTLCEGERTTISDIPTAFDLPITVSDE